MADTRAYPPLVTSTPPVGSVTLAMQADLGQSTVIGRAEGAGTGVPQALTVAQQIAIIDEDFHLLLPILDM